MNIDDYGPGLFAHFAPHIEALPSDAELTQADLLNTTFLRARERTTLSVMLAVYYAPFEYVNADALIALVGITPGWQQMEIAYRVSRDGLKAGKSHEAILREVKQKASFAGAMRSNIANMLNELGVNSYLSIATCASLFDEHYHLLHTTSAIRYPVFKNGKNYSGSGPDILKVEVFRQYIHEVLAPELGQLKQALIVPFGRAVEGVIKELVLQEAVSQDQCLLGFPHPSPANFAHRPKQFAEERKQMREVVRTWFDGLAQKGYLTCPQDPLA